MKIVFKTTVFVFCFLWISFPCEGKKVPGYIVTEDRDTIYGDIYIYRHNPISSLFLFNCIDDELYHYQVAFKHKQEKKYRIYQPEDICEFRFRFKDEDYVFQRIRLEKRSLIPEERVQFRFFRLIYSNSFSLYQDRIRIRQAVDPMRKRLAVSPLLEESLIVTDLYLYNADLGLTVVDGSISVADLLKLYGMEEAFIKSLPHSIKTRDILKIISEYELWRVGK